MKVTSYAVARPNYYDRNSISTFQTYDATPAPHSQVTRWTTTVAAGKKLVIEQFVVGYYVVTAGTVAGNYGSQLYVVGQLLTTVGAATNTVGFNIYTNQTGLLTVYAGEAIYASTYNYTTGGTISHLANFKGTTFDA
jgi:hypothetical protein